MLKTEPLIEREEKLGQFCEFVGHLKIESGFASNPKYYKVVCAEKVKILLKSSCKIIDDFKVPTIDSNLLKINLQNSVSIEHVLQTFENFFEAFNYLLYALETDL